MKLVVTLILFSLISISACSSQVQSETPNLETADFHTRTPYPTGNPTINSDDEEVHGLATATLAPWSILPSLPKSRLFYETKIGINAIDIECDTNFDQCFTEPYSISVDAGEMEVSPDGQLIAISYVQNYSDLYRGSSIRLISRSDHRVWAVGHMGTRYPVWSPDSQQIAYIDDVGSGSVYSRICFSTTIEPYRCLPTDENAESISSLTWSPDGMYVAFCAHPNIKSPCYLYLFHLASSSAVIISNHARRNLVWSPDSSRLLFYEQGDEGDFLIAADIQACFINDGSCLTELDQVVTTNNFEFSPDGNYASFLSGKGLGVIDATCFLEPSMCTDLPVYLTDPEIEVRDYSWSPESHHIAYAVLNVLQAGIYIVEINGAGTVFVERLDTDYSPRIDWRAQ